MSDEMTPRSEAERRSLDITQRVLASLLIMIVMGAISATLAGYLVLRGEHDLAHSDVVGLWVMTGVIGLMSAAAVLGVNRRPLYHPLVLLGLIPMAASGYWIFR
ncbi:hypothetical protein FOE78_15270 [Microlunatus elymi]|uniref:Uncharacterized protein n=1 Tax=Microlunatus elymi TaxID=2596828 RepID=A0A516Q108_9ACTN|nr:hypothetical protein [Microlunatus elymi]QDP97106.1 hypothetical protein FOE78_15270 [Microlunatus elymi]